MPTIKQLRYFVALEKHEHFGAAAEACFVSQPAFSIAIRELESLLNVQLVDRTNKNVTITGIGRDVAVQARLVLRDLEDLVEITRGAQSPLSGEVKLGVIPTIAPFVLPSLLPQLRKRYPLLKLFLKEDLTDRIYEQLMRGDLDLILIAQPYELRQVEQLTLFRDPFHLAFRKGSRLVDPDSYNIERLPPESILLLEDGHCLRDHALSACRIRNADKVNRITATSMLTLIQMVDSDLGITFLPELAIRSTLLTSTQVRTSPLGGRSFREVGLAWRRGSMRAEEFRLLGDVIREVASTG